MLSLCAFIDFLSKFTEWKKYEHRVLGNINGELVPIPFNLTSLYRTSLSSYK